ncbi:MAG: hypothetical protein Tsb009_22420 [Planctomycetaceae bacterium]
MRSQKRCWLFTVLLSLIGSFHAVSAADKLGPVWQAGFSRVAITPQKPMFASGYGGRNKPSQGKIHDLYVRAAAIRDPSGKTVLFIALDLIGIHPEMANPVIAHAKRKYGLKRADIMLCCSHTHCGPALNGKLSHMLDLKENDWKRIREYQIRLDQLLLLAVDRAMQDLQPVRVFTGNGKTTFAVNRRKPIGKGPTDHDVPVLKLTTPDGKTLRGVIFGYACHNTTLSFYKWCGDYAGFAALTLEGQHENAVALFFTGCGADQNPLPRRKVELAEKYGRMLASAVNDVMKGHMQPVSGNIRTAYRSIELAFDTIPSKATFEAEAKTGNRYQKARAKLLLADFETNGKLSPTHPYPVQVWAIGKNVNWIALGGEIVVDYSLRLKKELGRKNTWVAGYANDVMAYIPSERVLKEGGYEGGTSMLYYQLPTRWKPGLENQIISTVKSLIGEIQKTKH